MPLCMISSQGGITCGVINERRKSSKAIDKRVIINFCDKLNQNLGNAHMDTTHFQKGLPSATLVHWLPGGNVFKDVLCAFTARHLTSYKQNENIVVSCRVVCCRAWTPFDFCPTCSLSPICVAFVSRSCWRKTARVSVKIFTFRNKRIHSKRNTFQLSRAGISVGK